MTFYMAVDPGGTTGLAFRLNKEIKTTKVNSQEDLWAYFMPGEIWPELVILEEWQYFNGVVTPAGFHTANLVASLRGICFVHRIPLYLRTPGSRAAFQGQAEAWLKRNKGMKGHEWVIHEADALAHLLKWESQNRDI